MRLRARRAELDLAGLRQDILQYQEQLEEMAKRRQFLVIKKGGKYAYISCQATAIGQ
ncbi:MAG: hypothetical protein ABFD13_06320 [Candidatus Cryosericum sp.]